MGTAAATAAAAAAVVAETKTARTIAKVVAAVAVGTGGGEVMTAAVQVAGRRVDERSTRCHPLTFAHNSFSQEESIAD